MHCIHVCIMITAVCNELVTLVQQTVNHSLHKYIFNAAHHQSSSVLLSTTMYSLFGFLSAVAEASSLQKLLYRFTILQLHFTVETVLVSSLRSTISPGLNEWVGVTVCCLYLSSTHNMSKDSVSPKAKPAKGLLTFSTKVSATLHESNKLASPSATCQLCEKDGSPIIVPLDTLFQASTSPSKIDILLCH